MGYILTGDQQKTASRRIGEILRQFGQDEYPHNPEAALDALQAFSEGRFEAVATRKWREEDGIIRFSVTSDGTTGEQWIARLERQGKRLREYVKSVLRSPDFRPTSGVTTEVGVLKGSLFSDSERTTSNVRAEASRRGWIALNAEAACLIREKFSDEDLAAMGLWWIVVMHEPIQDSAGGPCLLGVDRGDGGSWLDADVVHLVDRWRPGDGFAFALPQVV